MLETLFARPSAIARYRSAPMLKERLRYLAHCEQIGIKPETLRKIASHQLGFVRALDLQDGDNDVNRRKIEDWSLPAERKLRPRVRRRFFSHAERWLRFQGSRNGPEAVCHSRTREIAAFVAHMSGECGWSDATIQGCCRTVNRFFWLDETGVDLASVGITVIDQVIANYHARGYCQSTTHLYAQQLRTFFRFAEQRSWCKLAETAAERPLSGESWGLRSIIRCATSYRQAEIYARGGVELDRSTLADWVGQTARLIRPLVDAIATHVMAADRVHADETTVPVLEPGLGKTSTGRLWCYVRDDRPFAGQAPPAVLYRYSPDRKGEHPRTHLERFRGILQADG